MISFNSQPTLAHVMYERCASIIMCNCFPTKRLKCNNHLISGHWLVVRNYENKVILRNGAFPQFHLANALGQTVATVRSALSFIN